MLTVDLFVNIEEWWCLLWRTHIFDLTFDASDAASGRILQPDGAKHRQPGMPFFGSGAWSIPTCRVVNFLFIARDKAALNIFLPLRTQVDPWATPSFLLILAVSVTETRKSWHYKAAWGPFSLLLSSAILLHAQTLMRSLTYKKKEPLWISLAIASTLLAQRSGHKEMHPLWPTTLPAQLLVMRIYFQTGTAVSYIVRPINVLSQS